MFTEPKTEKNKCKNYPKKNFGLNIGNAKLVGDVGLLSFC